MSRISFGKRNNSGYVFVGGNWTKGTGNYKTTGSTVVRRGPAGLACGAGVAQGACAGPAEALPPSSARAGASRGVSLGNVSRRLVFAIKRSRNVAEALRGSSAHLLKTEWRMNDGGLGVHFICCEVGTQRCLGLCLYRQWIRSQLWDASPSNSNTTTTNSKYLIWNATFQVRSTSFPQHSLQFLGEEPLGFGTGEISAVICFPLG